MADNIFDKLDEQEQKIDKLAEQIADISIGFQKFENKTVNESNAENESTHKRAILKDFLQKSTKCYRWLGSEKDFRKDKIISIFLHVSVIAIGLISTFLTSISIGIYSTFTLFENIMVFAAIWQLTYICKLQLTISDTKYSLHASEIFKLNNDNLWVSTNKEKKRYKVTRVLCYIAIICNIISIWTIPGSSKSIAATIFEIIYLGSVIAARLFYVNLTCMYNLVFFSGKTQDGRSVTLVWDGRNELIDKEEFDKKYSYLK